MKIIIEHGNTKRWIDGPFNICGNNADLQGIADQILAKLAEGHHYGWVRIITGQQKSISDTPPSPWD